MMFIDIVNLNGDASCLQHSRWMKMLSGGHQSELNRWLRLYVSRRRVMVLGIPGATASDIADHNPEAIETIRSHPHVFQLIVRPYAHDLALLRSPRGFRYNLDVGMELLRAIFGKIEPFYLPPEFMLTSAQVGVLADLGLTTFVNPDRLDSHVAQSLTTTPFSTIGTGERSTLSLPVHPALTRAYLLTIQTLDRRHWLGSIVDCGQHPLLMWRDGESVFLLPNSLEREEAWLEASSGHDWLPLDLSLWPQRDGRDAHPYPLPSLSAWVKEMKMYWYVEQLKEIESGLDRIATQKRHLWLQAINSDILSSVEKRPPVVTLTDCAARHMQQEWCITRHSKALEGEDYLHLLQEADDRASEILASSRSPHLEKARARLAHLASISVR